MSFIEFTGQLDQQEAPAGAFVPFSGELDAPNDAPSTDFSAAATNMMSPAPAAPAQTKPTSTVKPEGSWDPREGSWPDDRSEVEKGLASAVTGIKSMGPAAGIAGGSLVISRIGERLANWDKIDRGEFVPRSEGLAYQNADAAGRKQLRGQLLAETAKQKDFIRESTTLVKRYQSEQRANRGKTVDFTDVEDVQGFTDWLAFNGAAGAVYLAPVMLAAAVGGPAGALATSYGLAAGELNAERVAGAIQMTDPQRFTNPDRQQAAAAGREQAIAGRVAETVPQTAAFALPIAGLDVAAGPVRNVITQPLKNLTRREVLQRAPGMAAQDIVEEGLTGAAQEVVGIAAERFAGEQGGDFATAENAKRVLNAGMAEAAGGPFGTAMNVGGGLMQADAPTKPSSDEQAAATVVSAPTLDDAIQQAAAVVQEKPVSAAPAASAPAPAPATVELPAPAAAADPIIWTGRRGDGYESEAAAADALPSRQKVEPTRDWKIEPRGERFVLAGYPQPSASSQAVDNIGRILGLENTNASPSTVVSAVPAAGPGPGSVDAAAGLDVGMGTAGAGVGAVEPAGASGGAAAGAFPLGTAGQGAVAPADAISASASFVADKTASVSELPPSDAQTVAAVSAVDGRSADEVQVVQEPLSAPPAAPAEPAPMLADASMPEGVVGAKSAPPMEAPSTSTTETTAPARVPASDDRPAQPSLFARGGNWHSELAEQVGKSSMQVSKPEGWRAYISGLKQKGVKPDEIEWSGVDEWLKLQPTKVSKQQVLDYLDGNGVQVEEVEKGAPSMDSVRSKYMTAMQRQGASESEADRMFLEMTRFARDDKHDEALKDRGFDLVMKAGGFTGNEIHDATAAREGKADGTKYGTYTLPGSEGYKELLLTLPEVPNEWGRLNKEVNAKIDALADEGINLADLPDTDPRKVEIKRLMARGEEMPAPPEGYRSAHWDQSNVLAHIRFNDRTDAQGKKVLFVEELQSDWAQEGRKKGFVDPAGKTRLAEVESEMSRLAQEREMPSNRIREERRWLDLARERDTLRSKGEGVPRAPFVDKTDAWVTLALKRVVKYAADNGYDRVAFVNGMQSADRYDLSKQVDQISYSKTDGERYSISVRKDKKEVLNRKATAAELEDIVGKDIAKKIVDGVGHEVGAPPGSGELRGLDLKVGGDGMRAFYDKIVPAAANKLLAKLGGGKVQPVGVQVPIQDYERTARYMGPVHTFQDVNRLYLLSKRNGAPVYDNPLTGRREEFSINRVAVEGDLRKMTELMRQGKSFKEAITHSDVSGIVAELFGGQIERFDAGNDTLQQFGFDITPAMRGEAERGMPLFKKGGDDLFEAFRRSAVAANAPLSVTEVQRIVGELTGRWQNPPRIHVVANHLDLPVRAPKTARGFYNGEVWIVARLQKNRDQVGRTLAHEAIAHHGLENILGPEQWFNFRRAVDMGIKAGNKPLKAAAEFVDRVYGDLSAHERTHEIAARVIEDAVDPKSGEFRPGYAWLKATWARVADWLRSIGIDVAFTTAELHGMLVLAQRSLEVGGKLAGGGEVLVGAAQDDGGLAALGAAPFDWFKRLGQEPGSARGGLADAASMLGMPTRPDLIEDRQLAPEVPAALNTSTGAIHFNPAYRASRADWAQFMAEELMHAVDVVGPNTAMSASSERLLPGGDIHEEARQLFHAGRGLADFLAYPLDPVLQLPAERQAAELFARLAVIYHGDSGRLSRELPISYEAFHALFGTTFTGPESRVLRDVRSGAQRGAASSRARGQDAGADGGGGRSGAREAADQGLEALRDRIAEVFRADRNGSLVPDDSAGGRFALADTEAGEPPQAEPADPRTSPWRDATGRLQFAPGAWLYEKIGAGAGPILTKLQLKATSPELRRALREMKIQVARAQETAAAVAGEAMKLSEAERGMVSDLIEQELAAGTVPPEHAVRLAAMINASMGSQTDELVRLGMLSADSAEMWRGKYLPRYYRSKLGKQVTDAWADAVNRTLGRTKVMAGIKGKHLRGRGLNEPVAASAVAEWESLGWQVRDEDLPKGTTADDVNRMILEGKLAPEDTVNVWRDFTREERDSMGEIRDAGFRFVMGYMQTQRDIALGRMFEALAQDPDMSSKRETEAFSVHVPDGTVPGTGAKRYGKLSGRWVSKDTMSHLSQIEEAQSEAWRMYRKALGVWKQGKTSMNPVAHVNNMLSNTSMAHFAGVSYWDVHKYLAAARDFAFKAEGVKEAKDAGLFLGTLSDAELMNVLPEDLKALVRQQDSTAVKIGRTAFDVMTFFLRRPMGWAYQAEDTFFRYLIYKDARGRGMESSDAVDYAQKFIFAYDDLPKGARMARDVWVPFFGYTYKVIPALLQTALTHPIRFATPAAVLFAANAVSYAIATGEDEGEEWDEALRKFIDDEGFRERVREKEKLERELLPKWMRGTTALFTPRAIRLGMDEVTKLPLFIDIARIIPGGDVFDVSPNADGVPIPQWMMPSNPLLTTVIAMTANKDLYFGKELVDANDTRGEASEKRLAWMWRQASPAIAVGNYHFERGMNALAQASGGEVTWLPEWLSEDYTGIGRDGLPVQPKYAAMQTFGIKVRPLDLEMSENIEESQKKKLLRDIDAEMNRLKRLNAKGAVSDRVMEKERDKADVKKDRIREGLTVDGDKKD